VQPGVGRRSGIGFAAVRAAPSLRRERIVSAELHRQRIRVLVVDDEPLARNNLTVLLRADPEIEILTECGSGEEALAEIRKSRPHLVFLDIQMPECDGFDVLEMLGQDLPPAIIFVTAYDQYALRAFEAEALDYLLKPFDNSRFHRALRRAKERISNHTGSPSTPERMAVKSSGKITFLKISEIDWIEAADYYSCLHVGRRTQMLRRSISELERELDTTMFCRIHRSAIVRLDRVRNLCVNENGDYDVVLEDGTKLRSSRRYQKQLKSRLRVRALANS
jgi:two-component system LytT family response regulator